PCRRSGLFRSGGRQPRTAGASPNHGSAGVNQISATAPTYVREDLKRIASWIEPGSRVLDLGCGDGTLLAHLQNKKQCIGAGVELSDDQVIACVRRGVRVIQQNLEEGLALFDDRQFDTVVLSRTLQSMHNTERILQEMA